jgi:ADP-ribosyl-[dinitrogen reductase] hydrolase
LWEGRPLPQYDHLRDRPINNSGYVADTYASAWYSVKTTKSLHAAVVNAINRGDDADTVGAVTGMIAGRIYGKDSIKLDYGAVVSNKIGLVFSQLIV